MIVLRPLFVLLSPVARSLKPEVFASAPTPLHLELADPVADRAGLEALAAWCQRFGPSVGLEESAEPECLLVDITGIGALEGGERALAHRVVREFQHRGLTVRVAIADTLAAAWAVTRYGRLPEGMPERPQAPDLRLQETNQEQTKNAHEEHQPPSPSSAHSEDQSSQPLRPSLRPLRCTGLLLFLRLLFLRPPARRLRPLARFSSRRAKPGGRSRRCRSRPCGCRTKRVGCWPSWD